jgi:hypothetical protein
MQVYSQRFAFAQQHGTSQPTRPTSPETSDTDEDMNAITNVRFYGNHIMARSADEPSKTKGMM